MAGVAPDLPPPGRGNFRGSEAFPKVKFAF
jgi:hypothetical protein